jgi:hypothetical protein
LQTLETKATLKNPKIVETGLTCANVLKRRFPLRARKLLGLKLGNGRLFQEIQAALTSLEKGKLFEWFQSLKPHRNPGYLL